MKYGWWRSPPEHIFELRAEVATRREEACAGAGRGGFRASHTARVSGLGRRVWDHHLSDELALFNVVHQRFFLSFLSSSVGRWTCDALDDAALTRCKVSAVPAGVLVA
jgi:hypothetical protein